MNQRKRSFFICRCVLVSILVVMFANSVFIKSGVYAEPAKTIPKITSKKKISLKEGNSYKVKVSGKYIVNVVFSSSNKLVAVVNKKGKVTAKHTGTCKIKTNISYQRKKGGKIYKKSYNITVNVKHKTQKKLKSFIIRVNGKDFVAKVYNTKSGEEFYKKLPKTITMKELNGNEKYYYANSTFSEEEKKVGIIKTGDLMLYGNSCIVLFYDTFRTSYEYTRIGYIENPVGLAKEVGKGKAKVSFLKDTGSEGEKKDNMFTTQPDEPIVPSTQSDKPVVPSTQPDESVVSPTEQPDSTPTRQPDSMPTEKPDSTPIGQPSEIPSEDTDKDDKMDNTIFLYINGQKIVVVLENNSSANAFAELLKNSDITIDMHDYGNFEKVGSLGNTLPINDQRITTEAGDVILYQGNQITIYYDKNTWNFTRLGKVQGLSAEELKNILGEGNVLVTFSLQ